LGQLFSRLGYNLGDIFTNSHWRGPTQGCQMVCFQTKNPNLGILWRALDWKMFIYVMAIWNILWSLGIFYDHLVHFVFIWYIFSGIGTMYQENLATLDQPSEYVALGDTMK
jgi:hypothetical protein